MSGCSTFSNIPVASSLGCNRSVHSPLNDAKWMVPRSYTISEPMAAFPARTNYVAL
jgi:hypothetical protein